MPKRLIKSSWLQAYLRYTDVNESPELFHFWTGVSIIATALDRRVYSSILFNEFPNFYIILVAGSQKCRKSTAIDYGVDLLNMTKKDYYIMSQKMTPEAMISGFRESAEMHEKEEGEERATGLIVADEIATYLNKNSIQRGMLPVLLKLHDCADPFEYKTKSRGTERLPKSYANFLAGSAPEYLRESLPSGEAGGGMLARTILVYQEEPRKARPFLEYDEEHDRLEKKLVRDLEQIEKVKGDMELTENAYDWYENWYVNEWHSGKEDIDKSKAIKHYIAKKPGHLASLGMIISIAEDNQLVIKQHHFERALAVLQKTEQKMHVPLEDIVTEGRGVITKTVRDAIALIFSYNERPTYKRILQQVHETVDYEEMKRAIETLEHAGLIHREQARDNNELYFVPADDLAEDESVANPHNR